MNRIAAITVLAFVCSPLFAMKGAVYGPNGRIANAKIEVLFADNLATPRAVASSDADGSFSVDPKADGVVWLRVTATGYEPAMAPVSAKAGDAIFNLAEAREKPGTVRSAAGPVPGAKVFALDAFGDAIATYETDDKGHFSMPDPARWTASVCALHPSFAFQCHGRAEGGVPMAVDFNLVAGTLVTGRAVTPGGAPVANALVSVNRYVHATTGDDGAFKIRVAADDSEVWATTASAAGTAKIAKAPVTITLDAGRTINGSVRDENGRAIAGARVLVHEGSRTEAAVVNPKGDYSVAPLTATQYAMYVQAPDDFEIEEKDADLRKKSSARVDFTAAAAHLARGIVRDEKKQPVGGATVFGASPEIPLFYGHTPGQQTSVSGPDGRFKLPWRANGGRFAALKSGYAAGISDKLDAQSIRKDVVITLPAGIPVRGTVTAADKSPVAGASIVVMAGSSTLGAIPIASALATGAVDEWTRTDEHGAFTVYLDRGVHDFGIWKSGYAGRDVGNVDVNDSTAPLEVVLDPSVEIRGRVAFHHTRPDGTMTVFAVEQTQRAFGSATVAPDGSFVIESLQPGTYVLRVAKIRTTSQQAVTAPAKDVVIEEAETIDLRGRVVDKATGAALTNFSVTSEGENDNGENGDSDHPDGQFTEAVPPGPVHLTVLAPGYLPGTLNATVSAKSEPFTIALVKGRKITGRITSSDGHPIADAGVSIADQYTSSVTSDEEGDYDLDGVATEEVTLQFAKEGFRSARKVVAAGTGDQRIDVSLSSGLKISGRVVDKSGAPVEGASVSATSQADDAGFQNATSDKSGAFTIEGLAPAKYTFVAGKPQVGQATQKDVDVARPQQLVFTLGTDPTGTIRGTLAGAGNGGWMMAVVMVSGEHGSANAQVGRDGKFVVDNAPSGDVTVRGTLMGMNRQSSTKAVKVTLPPGGDVEVQLTTAGDAAVRGIVRSGGQPVAGASVSFWTADSSGSWETQTGADGAYEIAGLEAGHYNVGVSRPDGGGNYSTQFDVASSSTFDINIEFTQITGRVIDDRGAAIEGAKVKVTSSTPGRQADSDTVTDATGSFAITVQGGASYRVSGVKTGYVVGYADVPDGSSTPVILRLGRGNGARVRLIDARDGSTLTGYVVIRDETGKVQIPIEGDHQADGSLLLALPEGAYRVSASAADYASITIPLAVPSADATIPLTRGGTLIVRSNDSATELIRLVMPNGDEYVRCYCNGIAEIRLTGALTKVDHVAAGAYRMDVVDSHGVTKNSYPVTITENQETTVDATK